MNRSSLTELSNFPEVIVRRLFLAGFVLLFACSMRGSVLPGFSIKTLGTTSGFVTSLAADSKGTIYYTTQDGGLFRFERSFASADGSWTSTAVARVNTTAISDSGLLGMALRDDATAAVHYTTPNTSPNRFGDVLADVISWIDLRSGHETVLHTFVGDLEVPAHGLGARRGVSARWPRQPGVRVRGVRKGSGGKLNAGQFGQPHGHPQL